jgi:DNA polymerase III subunit delta'
MPLRPLYGHEGTRNRLAGAFASGRLPQALLFEGPRGVGKQRLALWLAQTILCDGEREKGKREACGECQSCKLVLNLSHPDVHWLVPVEITRKGADADKQVELAQDALAEEMAARREQPLHQPPSGLASHGIASVRLLARQLHLTPALGRRKVFIVGDAERLVPQPANPEAANALLKALEEPPADTVFVLTSSQPDTLLPTILSRVVRVRVARLPDSVVTEFAQRELGNGHQRDVSQLVMSAEGCVGRLLALVEGQDPGNTQPAETFLRATRGSGPDRYAIALAQQPFQARGGFTELLDGLLARLRAAARTGKETGAVVAAIARVLDARGMAQGNVNPQLLAAVLAEDMWSHE